MVETKCTFKYADTLTLNKTDFLSSKPLEVGFDLDYSLAQSDLANKNILEKEFLKLAKQGVKNQLKRLNQWLDEKSAKLKVLSSAAEKLEKDINSGKVTRDAANDIKNKKNNLLNLINEVKHLEKEYKEIVDGWVKNLEQQGHIAFSSALKKARIIAHKDKKAELRFTKVAKGVLIISGIVLAAVVLAATAGALAPAILGVAIAAQAMSGAVGIVNVGVMCNDIYDTEKLLLKNVSKDLEELKSVLDNTNTTHTKMRGHLTDLANLIKIKDDKIITFRNELDELESKLSTFKKNLVELLKITTSTAIKKQAETRKKIELLEEHIKGTKKKLSKVKSAVERFKTLAKDLKNINVKLENVAGIQPKSLIEETKQLFTTTEGWKQLAAAFSGFAAVLKASSF